jgi:hypothetical protein
VLGGAAVVALTALVPTAAHAADPVVLDTVTPFDVAASGATVAWLRPDSPDVGAKVQLVVRDAAGAVPRVVAQSLPARTNDLAIGTDAAGKAVAVVATRSSAATHAKKSTLKGALYTLPLDGSAAPKRLPVSKSGTDVVAPGLFRGTLSFARLERAGGEQVWTVRTGKVTGAASKVVTREDAGTTVTQTAPTADRRVAYVTSTPTATGATLDLRLKQPSAAGKRLSHTGFGGASETGFGPLTVSADGEQLAASRWTTAGGHPHDFTVWALPGGKTVSTTKTDSIDVAVPVGTEGIAVTGTEQGLVLRPAAG